jgi:hypothetical protein
MSRPLRPPPPTSGDPAPPPDDGGRAWLPLALVVAGVSLLSGCIYIPIPERTIAGTNVAAQIGGPNSSKPLRLGRTHRQEVLRVLGEPAHRSPDGREMTYTWGVQVGIWVWPLCGHPNTGGHELTLKFNEAGVLLDTEVPKEYRGPYPPHIGGPRNVIRWGW